MHALSRGRWPATKALCLAIATSTSLARAANTFDHVVIVIEENKNFSSVIGDTADAPYINNTLLPAGVNFTNFYSVSHPSQPNYLQLFSGSNQGNRDDNLPAGIPFNTPNLGAALLSAGKTFGGYSEDLPSVGSNVATSAGYARKHNPWVNWQGVGANQLPTAVNMPFAGYFPSDYTALPNVSIVVPNLTDDMHDGSIAQGDTWLQNNLGPYAAWAQTHNSLLIVTFDEDANGSGNGNRIPTLFYGANLRAGATVSTTYTLHNLLSTVSSYYGAAAPGAAAQTKPIYGALAGQNLAVIRSFQQGDTNGYAGTHDTTVRLDAPNTPQNSSAVIVADGDTGSSTPAQGLIRFDNITGNGSKQVPAGANILSAKLIFHTADASLNSFSLYRMLTPWSDTATWNSLGSGLSADGVEAASSGDFTYMPDQLNTEAIFDVTDTLQLWANGASNYGWAILPTGTDGWQAASSEAAALSDRPYLEVTFTTPEPASLALLIPALLLFPRRRRS